MWLGLLQLLIYYEVFACNYVLHFIFIQKPAASGMFGYPETSQL